MLALGIRLFNRVKKDNIFDSAAQLSYYSLLSFFPLLLLLMTLISYLPISSDEIMVLLKPYAPKDTYDLIQSHMYTIFDKERGGLLPLTVLGAIYVASLGFMSVIRILNGAYRVKSERPFLRQITLSFLLMLGLFLAIITSLLLTIFGHVISEYVFNFFGISSLLHNGWDVIRWSLSSVVLFLVFIALYKIAPNRKSKFTSAIPGALFATLGWQLSSLLFSVYVSFGNYSFLYGNLGGIIILVGWIYWSSLVLILGAHINAILAKKKRKC